MRYSLVFISFLPRKTLFRNTILDKKIIISFFLIVPFLTYMNLMNQNIISVNQNLQQTNRYARIATDNLNTCRWLSELSTYKRLF